MATAIGVAANSFIESLGRNKNAYISSLKNNKFLGGQFLHWTNLYFLKKWRPVHSEICGVYSSKKCMSSVTNAKTEDSREKAWEFCKDKKLVPESVPPSDEYLSLLYNFVQDRRKLVVLTGAGISTECGIPDYRSPHGAYSSGFKPITHQEFVRSAKTRKRYWARSYAGWWRFSAAQPGPVHKALATLETRGWVHGIVTQNVDRLHSRAGSNPIELHGTTHSVICLDCGFITSRHAFQDRVKYLNSEWALGIESLENGSDVSFGMKLRPDGDIEIDERFWEANFHIPTCEQCGGVLKPNKVPNKWYQSTSKGRIPLRLRQFLPCHFDCQVVFFGDNVPKERADKAMTTIKGGDAVLVLGSSLMTMSAYRLVRAAYDMGSPIAIINIGVTRADKLASLKIEARCGEVLSRLLTMCSIRIPTII